MLLRSILPNLSPHEDSVPCFRPHPGTIAKVLTPGGAKALVSENLLVPPENSSTLKLSELVIRHGQVRIRPPDLPVLNRGCCAPQDFDHLALEESPVQTGLPDVVPNGI